MQIFISHSQKDQKIARELRSELAAAGMKVWLAADEVLPGANLSAEVGKALEHSNAMVVLLSPDAVESRNVRSEITYALSSPKFEGRVFPVVVKPTKDIPWFLQTLPLIQSPGIHPQSVRRIAEKVVESLTDSAKPTGRVMGEAKATHR